MAIYERLQNENESSKAYRAFLTYMHLGVNRSIETAWKQHTKSDRTVGGYFSAWAANYRWVARAAAWDDHVEREAHKKVEKEAISRKAQMLRRHADSGRALQTKGLARLLHRPIERASDAIAAIRWGISLERAAEGLPTWAIEIMDADDATLRRQYADLLAALGGADETAETPDADTDDTDADLDNIMKLG